MKCNFKKIFLILIFISFDAIGESSTSAKADSIIFSYDRPLQLYAFGESSTNAKADLIIFSYDRPLQLYALLESINDYVIGLDQIHVIYRASSQDFANGYELVKKDFNNINYVMQGENPREDFKPLTVKAFVESPNPYIIFAVDDIIVKDSLNLSECIELLEKTHAYGFYLRLGKNLSDCYAMNSAQQVPCLQQVNDQVYAWQFSQSELDWAYPHTVDMTLYRKKDIEQFFQFLNYVAPNSLEVCWANNSKNIMNCYGLCYETSKIVNVPLNIVQTDIPANRNMNFVSAQKLLEFFLAGLKIDIRALNKINNRAAHMNYEPTFRIRNLQ